jgi:hypothetical protein
MCKDRNNRVEKTKMKKPIELLMPGAKVSITLILLFTSYMVLAHLDDYLLVVRVLAPGFLFISSTIILLNLYKSSNIQTLGLAITATTGIVILFHAVNGINVISGNVLSFFFQNLGARFVSQFQVASAIFWLIFIVATLYELTLSPQKKRTTAWKTMATFGALGICLFIMLSVVREYHGIG